MPYGARIFSGSSRSSFADRGIEYVPCNPVHFSVARMKSNRASFLSDHLVGSGNLVRFSVARVGSNRENSSSNRFVSSCNLMHFPVVRVGCNRASSSKIVSSHTNNVKFFSTSAENSDSDKVNKEIRALVNEKIGALVVIVAFCCACIDHESALGFFGCFAYYYILCSFFVASPVLCLLCLCVALGFSVFVLALCLVIVGLAVVVKELCASAERNGWDSDAIRQAVALFVRDLKDWFVSLYPIKGDLTSVSDKSFASAGDQ